MRSLDIDVEIGFGYYYQLPNKQIFLQKATIVQGIRLLTL